MEKRHKKRVEFSVVDIPVNGKLIATLENLLEDANSGDLQGLFYVCNWQGGWVSYGWNSPGISRALLGETDILQAEMRDALRDE